MAKRAAVALLSALLGAACSPALDWRTVRPGDSGASLMFPCKPSSQTRPMPLAGAQVRLALHACRADGVTWGFAFADLDDPARVAPALAALRAAAAANLSAAPVAGVPWPVPGATPNAENRRLELSGRAPDGRALSGHVGVATRGLRVYQATALGERLDAEAVATFLGSVRLAPP